MTDFTCELCKRTAPQLALGDVREPGRTYRNPWSVEVSGEIGNPHDNSWGELAEPLGADTLLHGRFGEARELVTVRQGGHVQAKPGEKRRFSAEPGHLHVFDSQTGKRIADAG